MRVTYRILFLYRYRQTKDRQLELAFAEPLFAERPPRSRLASLAVRAKVGRARGAARDRITGLTGNELARWIGVARCEGELVARNRTAHEVTPEAEGRMDGALDASTLAEQPVADRVAADGAVAYAGGEPKVVGLAFARASGQLLVDARIIHR
jgi:hypothetical protein